MKKRAAIIVLDSVGIGAMPDAGEFGDAGAHTLGNINAARPLNIPNLTALGIGNIETHGFRARMRRRLLSDGQRRSQRQRTQRADTGRWQDLQ